MARTGVTYEDIAQAATQLLSRGESASIQKVREVLGTGSNSTIAEHLKHWKEQRVLQSGIVLPDSLPADLLPPLEVFWQIATEQADQRYLEYRQHAQARLQQLTSERDTWQQQTHQLQIEIDHQRQTIAALNQQLDAAEQSADKNALQLHQNRQEIKQLQDELQQSGLALNNQREQCEQILQQQNQRHEQEAQKHQAVVTEFNQALEKERHRFEQSESRWLRLIDQTRDEIKTQEKKHDKRLQGKDICIQQQAGQLKTQQDRLLEQDKILLQHQHICEQQQQTLALLREEKLQLLQKLEKTEASLEQWRQYLVKALPEQTQEQNEK